MITEHLMRPGTGNITFTDELPLSAAMQIAKWLPDGLFGGPGCHLVITPTRIEPDAIGDAAALSKAIYTGRIDARPSRQSLEVSGLGVWLDSYLDTAKSRVAGTPTQWLGDLLTNGLSIGTVSGGNNVTRVFLTGQTTRREALDAIAATGSWKYRINPNFTVDAGTNLFVASPKIILTRNNEGPDDTLRGVAGGLLDQNVDVGAIATKALNLAGTAGAGLVIGQATKATTLKTPVNGVPVIVAVCSSPGDDSTNADTVATNYLNLQSTRRSVDVSSTTPLVRTLVQPGDVVYLFDPDSGLTDPAQQTIYRGEVINPMLATLTSITWPTTGMGHYIRSNTGLWLDVTDWVEDEGDVATWTVGDWAPDASYGRANRTSPDVEERVTADQRGLKFLPANVDNSTTAFADVTGLSIPIDATKRYHFKFVIWYDVPATTTGSGWAVNGPAGLLRMTKQQSLTTTSKTFAEAITTFDSPAAANASSAATVGNLVVMEGTFQPSASGTLIARFKSEVAASTVSARASGFSYVEWTEVLQ